MSVYKEILQHSEEYAKDFRLGHLQTAPARKLVILTCMDSRMDLEELLDLRVGDAHMIRNAGGLATDDAMRSMILSTQLLDTRTIVVIQHTHCGLTTFTDQQIRERIQADTGYDASSLEFHAFSNLEDSVRAQVKRIRDNPFLPKDVEVYGFAYDVKTGQLREVRAETDKSKAGSAR